LPNTTRKSSTGRIVLGTLMDEHRQLCYILPAMQRIALGLLVLLMLSCGGGSKTPTTPSPPPQPPIPSADIRLSGQGTWTNILPIVGDGIFAASIQNVGAGCASGTAVIARFFDGNNQQVGSDTQMGGAGASLSGLTIRPQEISAIRSVGFVPAAIISRTQSYRLFPTWNDVRCP
jgi:hypothetical protein